MKEKERIKDLKVKLQLLQMEISEVQFLINGYENAIKESNEKESKAS